MSYYITKKCLLNQHGMEFLEEGDDFLLENQLFTEIIFILHLDYRIDYATKWKLYSNFCLTSYRQEIKN